MTGFVYERARRSHHLLQLTCCAFVFRFLAKECTSQLCRSIISSRTISGTLLDSLDGVPRGRPSQIRQITYMRDCCICNTTSGGSRQYSVILRGFRCMLVPYRCKFVVRNNLSSMWGIFFDHIPFRSTWQIVWSWRSGMTCPGIACQLF